MGLSEILALTKQGLIKHGPKIAKGIGVGGMFAAGYFLHKGIEESKELVKEKKEELEKDELDLKETVKTTWKCYIYPVVLGGGSLILILWGENEEAKRTAALATAYSLSESALKEYRQKVIETVGEKKEKQIRDEVAKDTAKQVSPSNNVIFTGKGQTRCIDSLSKQEFFCDIETIRQKWNEFNFKLIHSDSCKSVNDWLYMLSPNLVWNLDTGMRDTFDRLGWSSFKELLDIDFTSCLNKSGEPCLVIVYLSEPVYDFDKFS